MRNLLKKIFAGKKFVIGLIIGLALSFGAAALAAAVNDAWNIGEGWLWFATASDDSVKANVQVPIDEENVVNKAYVDAQTLGAAGGVSCSSSCQNLDDGDYDQYDLSHCYTVCCMPNTDGSDLICVSVYDSNFAQKYSNGQKVTIP